jgi:hypothetical protein
MIVRVFHESFEGKLFGYCDSCNQDSFDSQKYEGRFIRAHDQAPFINPLNFESDTSISSSHALIVDRTSNKTLSLTPFIFWFNRPDKEPVHACYFYDKRLDDEFLIKPCDQNSVKNASDLSNSLSNLFRTYFSDSASNKIFNIKIQEKTRDEL